MQTLPLMYKTFVVKPREKPQFTYVEFTFFYMNVVLCLSITSLMSLLLHTRFDWPLTILGKRNILCYITRLKLSWIAFFIKVWTLLRGKLSIYLPFWQTSNHVSCASFIFENTFFPLFKFRCFFFFFLKYRAFQLPYFPGNDYGMIVVV